MADKFLVSVADVILRDPTTKVAIAHGVTNATTSLTQTMQKTEARGGINNPLRYTYYHDRNVEFKIEMTTFNEYVLALNSGTTVANGSVQCVKTDCVTLSSGSGTLTKTPVGNVTVIYQNGATQTVTPVGTSVYIAGGGSQMVDLVYDYMTTADRLTVGATTPPSIVELILTAEVRDASHSTVLQYFQVVVPSFSVAGNYTLSLTANGISNQSLDGTALVNKASDCSSGDYFYTATWIDASGTIAPVVQISATPDPVPFSVAAGLPASKQISVLGIRGGVYQNFPITTSCSYVKTSGCASITVSSGGLVTAGSAAAASHNAIIGVTYYDATSGSLTDTVQVMVSA